MGGNANPDVPGRKKVRTLLKKPGLRKGKQRKGHKRDKKRKGCRKKKKLRGGKR